MKTKTVCFPNALNIECKNIVVSGMADSDKIAFVHAQRQNTNVLFCEFDRDKYVLYGKDVSLTNDVILKNALFSCSNTVNVCDFEAKLNENTTVVIDNFDIAFPTPYMRHLFNLPAKIVVVTERKMKNPLQNCQQIVLANNEPDIGEIVSALDEKEYELLLSLACMLCYLEGTTKIVSSSSGVFDRESVDFYLGSLSNYLNSLEEKHLAIICHNGRVCIPKKVENYVIKKISPKPCDLPILSQFFKNVKYKPCNYELCDVMTYFALKDEDLFCDLLKIMIGDAVQEKEDARLFHRNAPYLASKLLDVSLFENNSELYIFCKNKLKLNSVSPRAIAALCTIKVCCHNLAGKSTDMYKGASALFLALKDAIDSIARLEDDEREYAAKCAIEYCKNVLFFFSAIHPTGEYKAFRDERIKHRISSFVNNDFNEQRASSISFAYSKQTVSLYASFQKLLCMFPKAYQEQIKLISVNFWRTVKGYNQFYDFFDKSFTGKIEESAVEMISDKIILDNKRYLVRGFDGGTRVGAKGYSQMMLKTVKESENPLALIFLVLNPQYPIGNDTYKNLIDKGFDEIVSKHERLSNLSKQDILETLVLNLDESELPEWLLNLYVRVIKTLEINIKKNDSFLSNMHETSCRMYVLNALKNPQSSISEEIFEMFYLKDVKSKTPEEILAKAIFNCKKSRLKPKNKAALSHSIACLKKQYAMADVEISGQSFDRIAKMLNV